jgi:hypothetical protein
MRRTALLGIVLAALAALPAPAGARTVACGTPGYSYAGLGGMAVANGVAATIRLNVAPQVGAGHVAAWVGLGGYGAGTNGANAWIQAGIITKAGSAPALYYEVTRPGYKPELVTLGPAQVGRSYRVVVREGLRPGWWSVEIDGRPASPAFSLPGSHRSWEGTATTESWDDNAGLCNRFDVGFESVVIRRSGSGWQPFGRAIALEAPGYRLSARTTSGFRAVS